jgi:hydroxymethylglutaryl-CoA lyase
MIPQMRDTPEVLELIDMTESSTKLLTIIGNKKGAERAAKFEQVTYLGYPFSISETFQLRNTNATIAESQKRLLDIQEVCSQYNKKLVVYLSMGFGNPYGDPWSEALSAEWTLKLHEDFKVQIISLSDTIGAASPDIIREVFKKTIPYSDSFEIGAHLHAKPNEWQQKIATAVESGCRRFDAAIMGYGGCPYAGDQLTGNIPTEKMVTWLESEGYTTNLEPSALQEAVLSSHQVFNH